MEIEEKSLTAIWVVCWKLLVWKGTYCKGKVCSQEYGNLIGTSHKNPIEDTSQYEIQFDTGEVETYTANQIAKHVYALADTEGYSALL